MEKHFSPPVQPQRNLTKDREIDLQCGARRRARWVSYRRSALRGGEGPAVGKGRPGAQARPRVARSEAHV